MRRALVEASAVMLVGLGWLMLRPQDDEWVVDFSIEVGLSGDDPCSPSPLSIGGYATGPGNYGGLAVVASRADGQKLVACYVDHGGQAEVRTATHQDRQQLDDASGG